MVRAHTGQKKMRILIACEESQVVTKAFRDKGHEAYSCDILPTSGSNAEWHIQGDVTELLKQDWDMIIAFPPCTDLCISGAKHFAKKIADGRQQKSIDFFMLFVNLKCPKVAIENPIGIMSTKYRKPDVIIQPYHFGEKAQKSTCLWLKGLPTLLPTNVVEKGEMYEFTSKKGVNKKQPMWYFEALKKAKSNSERSTVRSKTFPGIALAMADQWGGV